MNGGNSIEINLLDLHRTDSIKKVFIYRWDHLFSFNETFRSLGGIEIKIFPLFKYRNTYFVSIRVVLHNHLHSVLLKFKNISADLATSRKKDNLVER